MGKDKLITAYIGARLESFETYWKKFLDTHDSIFIFKQADSYIKFDLFTATREKMIILTLKQR